MKREICPKCNCMVLEYEDGVYSCKCWESSFCDEDSQQETMLERILTGLSVLLASLGWLGVAVMLIYGTWSLF